MKVSRVLSVPQPNKSSSYVFLTFLFLHSSQTDSLIRRGDMRNAEKDLVESIDVGADQRTNYTGHKHTENDDVRLRPTSHEVNLRFPRCVVIESAFISVLEQIQMQICLNGMRGAPRRVKTTP